MDLFVITTDDDMMLEGEVRAATAVQSVLLVLTTVAVGTYAVRSRMLYYSRLIQARGIGHGDFLLVLLTLRLQRLRLSLVSAAGQRAAGTHTPCHQSSDATSQAMVHGLDVRLQARQTTSDRANRH